MTSYFIGNDIMQFRPKELIRFNNRTLADGFRRILSYPRRLPWARLSWPFRPGFGNIKVEDLNVFQAYRHIIFCFHLNE